MIRNFLKSGFRSLLKNRVSSIVNVLSLALAVACCLVVFVFVDWEAHLDSFNHKLKNLFVVERTTNNNGNEEYWGDSPAPIGATLKEDFSQVKDFTRVTYKGVVIKQGDNVFSENIAFADSSLFRMFDFPIKWGSKFNGPNDIVLSDELSNKLFGLDNPVGKNISIRFDANGTTRNENFIVKGVLEKRPEESSWYFSALIPYQKRYNLGLEQIGKWNQLSSITFIEANDQSIITKIKNQARKYVELYNEANPNEKVSSFHVQPLSKISLHSNKVRNRQFIATDIAAYIMVAVIAAIYLLLVCCNYMNIAIASASTRLKEIGIRKVIGSSRKQIIVQFFMENIILSSLAVIIGLVLAAFLFIPFFSQVVSIQLNNRLLSDPLILSEALVALVVLATLGGASYPALYISRFRPVNILKGKNTIGNNNRFRKILLGIQFFLTFITFTIAISFLRYNNQMTKTSWGYEPSGNVVVTLDKSANYEPLKNELKNFGGIQSVTGSTQSFGEYSKEINIKVEGKDQTVQALDVLPGFATQMKIQILAGRDLDEQYKSDKLSGVLVNQEFAKQMNWKNIAGKNLTFGGKLYQVVGETNDFRFESFQSPIRPIIIFACNTSDVNYAYVKTSGRLFGNEHLTVGKIWKKVNSNQPFEYHYQESVFDPYFYGLKTVSRLLTAVSLIMMLISASGIFGLALILLNRKMKEISVRKVLGARFGNITFIINKEFMIAIATSLILGIPVSWQLINMMSKQIIYGSEVSLLPFVISLISLLLMTLISISWHLYKANTSNPIRFLREE